MNRIPAARLIALTLCGAFACGNAAWAAEASPRVRISDQRVDPAVLEQAALASLQGTIESLGQGRSVQLDLVDLRALPDSVAGIGLDGVGRARIDNGAWIPLHFSASYDLERGEVEGLRVQPLTRSMRETAGLVDVGVHERVTGQVASRILGEFPDQALDIVFLELQPVEQGEGHLAFRGTGRVDFLDEGPAPLTFSAILDRESGLVMAMDYSLEVLGAHGEARWSESVALAD